MVDNNPAPVATKSAPVADVGANRLSALAVEIRKAHADVEDAIQSAAQRAIAAGAALKEAKNLCGHGQWLPWLEGNTPLSARQAQKYMRVAALAEEGKYVPGGAFNLNEVLELAATKVLPGPEPHGFHASIETPVSASDCDLGMRWLEAKILHKLSIPTMAHWGLALQGDYEIDAFLRIIPNDELAEALKLLAPVAKGEGGIDVEGSSPVISHTVHMVSMRLLGMLTKEVDHRQRATPESIKRDAEAVMARLRSMLDTGESKLRAMHPHANSVLNRPKLPKTAAEFIVAKLLEIDPRIKFSPTSMHLPDDLTFEQWAAVGDVFTGIPMSPAR